MINHQAQLFPYLTKLKNIQTRERREGKKGKWGKEGGKREGGGEGRTGKWWGLMSRRRQSWG
jgi:hypothetical protein